MISPIIKARGNIFTYLFIVWENLLKVTEEESKGHFLDIAENFSNMTEEEFHMILSIYKHIKEIPKPAQPPEEINIPLATKIILVVFMFTFFAASLVGNSVSAFVALSFRRTNTITSYFVVSLAISDILQTIVIVPSESAKILSNLRWVIGPFACKFIPFATQTSSISNALTLSCIAVGRYMAIVHSLRWRSIQQSPITIVTLATIWGIAVIIGVPNVFMFEYIDGVDIDIQRSPAYSIITELKQHSETAVSFLSRSMPVDLNDLPRKPKGYCLKKDDIMSSYMMKYYLYALPAIMFLPLFLIVAVLYSYIGYFLWIRKPVGDVQMLARQNVAEVNCRRKRIVKSLVGLILLFFLCRAPLNAMNLVISMEKLQLTTKVLVAQYILMNLKLLNCVLNPFFYSLLHDRFKTHITTVFVEPVRSLYQRCCKKKSSQKANGDTVVETMDTSGGQTSDGNKTGGLASRKLKREASNRPDHFRY